MKNNKTLRTALNSITFIAGLVALIMLLIHIIGSSWDIFGQFSYFYSIVGDNVIDLENCTIVMNWNFAGLFLTFTLIALLTWCLEFGLFTIPSFVKSNKFAGVKLFCKIMIGLGMIIALIGLLLPNGHSGADILIDSKCPAWNLANVFSWLGLPLSFGASLAHIGVESVK